MSIGSMMFRRFVANSPPNVATSVKGLDNLYYRIADSMIQTSVDNTTWINSNVTGVSEAYLLNFQIFWTLTGYISDAATPGYLFWAWLGSLSSPNGSNSGIRDSVISNPASIQIPVI